MSGAPLREPAGADRPRLRLVAFTARRQGALRGFATIELPIGLKLFDVAILAGEFGPWAALPSKAALDRERRQKTVAGKPIFTPVAEWRSRELADRFSVAVIALVRAKHPGALDGGVE